MPHILLLEPNTLLAANYTRAFTFLGHSVAHAATAQAGITAADRQQPDAVVLELQLPGHNGIEFLHEFRSYIDWQHIPVLVHTALTPARILPAMDALQRDLGVVTILYKPQTSLQILLHALAETLGAQ